MAYLFYGSRQMVRHLHREGVHVGRHRVRRLMGLEAIYQAPRTSRRHPAHRVYPYLLKGVAIERPGHVWGADIHLYSRSEGLSVLGGSDGLGHPPRALLEALQHP